MEMGVLSLNQAHSPKRSWKKPGGDPECWEEIRAEFDRPLNDEEIRLAAGSIGYALKQILHGERLSEPVEVVRKEDGRTIVRFSYDNTTALAYDPDEGKAFALAARYVAEGSPVRTTDRAGEGTAGTRLCHGLGNVRTRFWVR